MIVCDSRGKVYLYKGNQPHILNNETLFDTVILTFGMTPFFSGKLSFLTNSEKIKILNPSGRLRKGGSGWNYSQIGFKIRSQISDFIYPKSFSDNYEINQPVWSLVVGKYERTYQNNNFVIKKTTKMKKNFFFDFPKLLCFFFDPFFSTMNGTKKLRGVFTQKASLMGIFSRKDTCAKKQQQ
jgi:hypothetical protein